MPADGTGRITRQACADEAALAQGFCDYAADILSRALAEREQASLVLPGGNTPRVFLPSLARRPLDWPRVQVTLSDERWVAADSEHSNEHLLRRNLLDNGAAGAQLLGLKTPHASPRAALADVEARLRSLSRPFYHNVLGLGRDGHIASLFPGHEDGGHEQELCLAVDDCPPPRPRLSLTLPALAASRHLAIVYTDGAKTKLMDRVLEGKAATRDLPVGRLLRRTQAPVTLFEIRP